MKALNRRDPDPLAGLCSRAMFPKKFIENRELEEKAALDVGKWT